MKCGMMITGTENGEAALHLAPYMDDSRALPDSYFFLASFLFLHLVIDLVTACIYKCKFI